MRSTPGALALACLLAVLTPQEAEATITEALSLEDLVAQADAVALVTCTAQRASRDRRSRIVTDYTLVVEEALKGAAQPGARLTMRRLGGVLGDLGMRVEGEPSLVEGRRYVVFLRTAHERPWLRPVGMSQGVLPVEDAGGVLTVQPGGGGLSLVQPGARGQLHPAPAALLHPEQLESLRERVFTIRDRQASERGGAVRP